MPGPVLGLSIADWPYVSVSLLPVSAFLVGLVLLDSYKLVRARAVAAALAAGVGAAVLSFVVETAILTVFDLSFRSLSRHGAPFIEETAKAIYLVVLIRSHRVGFHVDAAILGFAIGTGFALVENVYYLTSHEGMGLFAWLIRGFGTAVMHGSTTCLFGILSKTLTERSDRPRLRSFLPGFLVACALHAAYNQFVLPPPAMTALLVTVFPAVVVVVFSQSERATRRWLGKGFDTDQALVESLTYGNPADGPVGRYLEELKSHFPGEVVADMLCLLRLRAEMSIRAKGIMMMREAGFRVDTGKDVQPVLEEMRYLERSIGPTGMLALSPFMKTTGRDVWQGYLLRDS